MGRNCQNNTREHSEIYDKEIGHSSFYDYCALTNTVASDHLALHLPQH